ncbi:MAG TPA: hypothetical protein DER23_00145, partial [Clostridiales bacterium]|nr:hypothetical protein [Clostridiales bacterium]
RLEGKDGWYCESISIECSGNNMVKAFKQNFTVNDWYGEPDGGGFWSNGGWLLLIFLLLAAGAGGFLLYVKQNRKKKKPIRRKA